MNKGAEGKTGLLKRMEWISSKSGDIAINYFFPLFNSVFVLDNYRRWIKEFDKEGTIFYQIAGWKKTALRIFLIFSAWSYFSVCLVTGIYKIYSNQISKDVWTEKFTDFSKDS